jgi:small conductance mechanosensitive channel
MPSNQSIRKELAGLIAVIAFAAAAGFIAKALYGKDMIPQAYLAPIYAIIVLITGYVWVLIITAVIEKVVEPTIGVTKARGIKNLFYIVAGIVIVAVIAAIFEFTSYLTGLLVSAGFAGIVLGLAAQQVLGNIFAGLELLSSHPFDIGDRITLVTSTYGLLGLSYPHESLLNGFTGVVTDITVFFTRMDLDDGTPATFPNSVVVGSMTVNHSKVTFRTTRVRMDLDKRLHFDTFRQQFLASLANYEVIEAEKCRVEIVEIGSTTYQVVMIVWSSIAYEEPIKTIIIQNALKIQSDMVSQLPKQ